MGGRSSGRRSMLVVALALSSVLLVQVLASDPASAAFPRTRTALGLLNSARERHARRSVELDAAVSRFAQRHSQRMAHRGRLFHHGCLGCILRRRGWRVIGENVGYASSIRAMSRLFMHSPPHRENILCRCFTRVGIGVVRSGGRVWMTEVFYRP